MTKLNDGSPLVIRFDSEGDHWQVVFDRNSSFEVTGEGDAQRIFATVLSAIGQFVKEHQPQSLTFSASKDVDTKSANPESRAKLYNRLVQRYASSVGYKVHSREQGDEVVYLLRPNQVQGIDEGYYQVPDNNIFPDGNLFLTGHAKNDRFPERDITTDRVINLCRQAGKQYPNKLANLGDSALVIQDPDEFGVGLIKQELPNGRYRYIVKTARDNLRTGVEQPVFKVIDENFADGKGPGRPGDSQRHGIPKGATMAQLEKAAKASGRKGQLARWQINMRRGKAKK
jgi:hypothetical protein